MAKYQKRNPVVDARQWQPPESESSELADWISWIPAASIVLNDDLIISLLEGPLRILPGDWVIKTKKDEVRVLSDKRFQDEYAPHVA